MGAVIRGCCGFAAEAPEIAEDQALPPRTACGVENVARARSPQQTPNKNYNE